MDNTGHLMEQMNLLKENYTLIDKRFDEFTKHIQDFINKEYPQLKGIEIHKIDNCSFSIIFLDRDLLFKKTFMGDTENNGFITCYQRTDEYSVEINKLEFNALGSTNIDADRPGEKYMINISEHAVNIFLNWLHASFKK